MRPKLITPGIRFLLVLGPLVLGCGAALSTKEKPPDTVIFSTSFGPVTFPHAKHQAFAPQQCATCHHPTVAETTHACRSCHKRSIETKEGDPPSFSEIKMKFCRGCHVRKKAEDQASKAPVICEGCHEVHPARGMDGVSSP